MTSLTTSILTITQTITGQSPRFTPPTDCGSKFTFEGPVFNAIPSGLLIRNALWDSPDATCYPPYFAAFGRAPTSVQVYSPAVCPSGYKTPVHVESAGTTTEVCCESGFSYTSYYSSANYADFSRIFLGCISTLTGSTVVPSRGSFSVDSSVTVTGPLTMWAQPITVAYQQKDLSLFASFSNSANSTAQQTGTSTSPGPSSAGQRETSGLSTGAKVGIGIAIAAILVILIAAAMFFIVRYRRRNLTSHHRAPAMYAPVSHYDQELKGYPKAELPSSSAIYEKSADVSEHDAFVKKQNPWLRPSELE